MPSASELYQSRHRIAGKGLAPATVTVPWTCPPFILFPLRLPLLTPHSSLQSPFSAASPPRHTGCNRDTDSCRMNSAPLRHRKAAEMIRLNCECGKTSILKGELHGQIVKCPACQRSIKVPDMIHAAPIEAVAVASHSINDHQLPKTPHVAQAAQVVEESTGQIVANANQTKPQPLPFSVYVIQIAAWLEVIGSLFALYIAFYGQLNTNESMSVAVLGCVGLLSCPFLFAITYIAKTVHRLEQEILGPRTIVMKKRTRAASVQKVQTPPIHGQRLTTA